NLNMLYATPLVLYCLALYFERTRLSYLLVAANVFGLSLLGTAGYTVSVQSLPVATVMLVCAVAHAREWRRYAKYTPWDIAISAALTLLLIIFSIAYWELVSDVRRFVFNGAPGR